MMTVITITLLYAIGVGAFSWGLINVLEALNISSFEESEEVKNFGVKCSSVGLTIIVITTFLNYFV